MPAWIWAIVCVALFGGASFFFALAESALFSLRTWRLPSLVERVPARGAVVARLLEKPQDLLATIVLGNTVANAAWIGTVLWIAFAEQWSASATWTVAIALFGAVFFAGEMGPKTLALRDPERWCLRVARPMVWLVRFARPLRWVAQRLNAAVLRLVAPKWAGAPSRLSDEEYQELTEMAFQGGTIREAEKEIIVQILRLDQQTAKDVMRPLSQMACLEDDLSVEEMIAQARRHKHRRLPLYDETPDTVVGVLNTRNLLLNPEADLSEAIEFPSFVPESMNLLQLLRSLQRQRRGMAMVLDEYGGTAGLVTVEDILEEMIGDLRSEGEEEGVLVTRLGAGRWRVNAATRVEDFQREYPELGEVEDVETMGGLVLRLKEVVPKRGETAVFRGLKMTVTAAEPRRIRELLVEAKPRKGSVLR